MADSIHGKQPAETASPAGPGADPSVSIDGKLHVLDLKQGDRILFGKWSGSEIKLEGEDMLIMKESDVLGVLDGRTELRLGARFLLREPVELFDGAILEAPLSESGQKFDAQYGVIQGSDGENPEADFDDLIDMALNAVRNRLDVTHMSVDDHASYVRGRLREALGSA